MVIVDMHFWVLTYHWTCNQNGFSFQHPKTGHMNHMKGWWVGSGIPLNRASPARFVMRHSPHHGLRNMLLCGCRETKPRHPRQGKLLAMVEMRLICEVSPCFCFLNGLSSLTAGCLEKNPFYRFYCLVPYHDARIAEVRQHDITSSFGSWGSHALFFFGGRWVQ